MVKQHLGLCIGIFFGAVFSSSAAYADGLPQDVANALQQREQHLSKFSFKWNYTLQNMTPAVHPDQQKEMGLATGKSVAEMYQHYGITDNKTLTRQTKRYLQASERVWRGGMINASGDLGVSRDGTKTLASGVNKDSPGLSITFRQLYQANLGLIVNDATSTSGGRLIRPSDPVAWASQGDSVRYPTPIVQGLGLLPEHFALLAGLNPVRIYGAKWNIVSETPQSWTITSTAAVDGYDTVHLQMTLDRNHGDVPEEIQTQRGLGLKIFHVLTFQKCGDDWLPSVIRFTDNAPGITHTTQTWTLDTVRPSNPIDFSVTGVQSVHDYRLLGSVTTWRMAQDAEINRNSDVVYYRWPGNFPSIDELKKLYREQHPGEATPDPDGKASMLPGVGGLLCLAGGILMYRRRSTSV